MSLGATRIAPTDAATSARHGPEKLLLPSLSVCRPLMIEFPEAVPEKVHVPEGSAAVNAMTPLGETDAGERLSSLMLKMSASMVASTSSDPSRSPDSREA